MSSDVLNKPLSECTDQELESLQRRTFNERKRRAFQELERVAEIYLEVHGHEHGINEMGEHLCKRIANRVHPGGWDALLRHLIKISG